MHPATHSTRAVRYLATLLIASVATALVPLTSAYASDATLRVTLNTWSRTIAIDAHSVALAARNRHPRRMIFSARRFHNDSLRARAAITRQHPSSASGRRARKLALAAYTNYNRAGTGWAASGRARLAHHTSAAKHAAVAAARAAHKGSTQLLAASKLLH